VNRVAAASGGILGSKIASFYYRKAMKLMQVRHN
jgi:NADH:ubiquinone oxidoreductase subunit 2 (subunit N)